MTKHSRRFFASFSLLVLSFGAFGEPARAADADHFLVQTTKDIVALCSANTSSPNYVAAVHFCHGLPAAPISTTSRSPQHRPRTASSVLRILRRRAVQRSGTL